MPKKNKQFFNRELSWIEFNNRVLTEATKESVPLLERLRFLGIITSNFDEFFMVRVASLKHQERTNPNIKDSAGLTPKEQLNAISVRTHQILDRQYDLLNNTILPELAEHGLIYRNPNDFTIEQNQYVESLFKNEVFPLLTPLRTDHETVFPHITSLRLHAAFSLSPLVDTSTIPKTFIEKEKKQPIAIVQVPTSLSRIIWLPSENDKKEFTLLDDIIRVFGRQLFPGYNVTDSLLFKVVRDADVGVDEDRFVDFIQAMEEVIVQRQSSHAVRLICDNSNKKIRDFLRTKLELQERDIYQVERFVDLATLADISDIDGYSALKYPTWKTFTPSEFSNSLPPWDVLKMKDVLLHLPYESYDPVLSFITEASEDPLVLAIKMTLYRTSGNSPIVHALERAARNGKQVTAFIELKARFDEKRNISWVSQLEQAGVIVVYGIANLKVHAKLMLVVRKETSGIVRYVHLSTGNYNDTTARLYSDLSLFTTNQVIANDATLFFNMISGYSAIQTMKKLVISPINLKSQLISLIERETSHSSTETPGLIIAKMNSLSDKNIIESLYKASSANVQIQLNVRGICSLVPGVKDMSENIKVISIIDRFLEHARIFYFQNGGNEEIYLSSADWMPRNLERRVELMFPVLQRDIFLRIKKILGIYFADNCSSHELKSDGTWSPRMPSKDVPKNRAQEQLFNMYKKASLILHHETPTEFIVRRSDKQN